MKAIIIGGGSIGQRHALNLQKEFPRLRLRFSFPRLMPSEYQSKLTKNEDVSQEMLFRAIVAIRLFFPDSSLVLTGRESSQFLVNCLPIVNVIGKDGTTVVGGYKVNRGKLSISKQFELNLDASYDEFVLEIKNRFQDRINIKDIAGTLG